MYALHVYEGASITSIKSSKGPQIRAAGSTHWIATNKTRLPTTQDAYTRSALLDGQFGRGVLDPGHRFWKIDGFSAPCQWFTKVNPTDQGIRSLTVQELARTDLW